MGLPPESFVRRTIYFKLRGHGPLDFCRFKRAVLGGTPTTRDFHSFYFCKHKEENYGGNR